MADVNESAFDWAFKRWMHCNDTLKYDRDSSLKEAIKTYIWHARAAQRPKAGAEVDEVTHEHLEKLAQKIREAAYPNRSFTHHESFMCARAAYSYLAPYLRITPTSAKPDSGKQDFDHLIYIHRDHSPGYEQWWVMLNLGNAPAPDDKSKGIILQRFARREYADEYKELIRAGFRSPVPDKAPVVDITDRHVFGEQGKV